LLARLIHDGAELRLTISVEVGNFNARSVSIEPIGSVTTCHAAKHGTQARGGERSLIRWPSRRRRGSTAGW
jgi:hypothetical protein